MLHAHPVVLLSWAALLTAAVQKLRPTHPFFSVVVLTWQRTEFLERAVASVLAQSVARADYEILVVRGYHDPALDARLLAQGVRLLPSFSAAQGPALAAAVLAAQGEVVVFLDDDDEFAPGKLAALRSLYDADPSLVLVRNGNVSIDRDGRPAPEWAPCFWPASPADAPEERRTPREKALGRTLPMHNLSTISARRSALLPSVGAWPAIPAGADATVFLSGLAAPGTVRAVPEPWTRRRIHPSTSLENFSDRGMGPPASLDRLRRLRHSHAHQTAMVEGTPAETAARWIEAIHRFEAALSAPEFPDPSPREWWTLLRGIVRERQPFRIPMLPFAAARRIAPRWVIAAWWRFAGRWDRGEHTPADYARLFPRPGLAPSRPSPRAPH
ncbi:MAG: glycosyltransferase family A protein [Thermoplasmata archaeon]